MRRIRKIVQVKAHERRGKLKKGLWDKNELAFLKKAFSNRLTKEIAQKLGRSVDTVKKKASRMGLHKTSKYMKSLGRG